MAYEISMTITIFYHLLYLLEQHQRYQWLHLLHKNKSVSIVKITQILNRMEYPGTATYSMDATLTTQNRKFQNVLNFFSDEVLSNCCVLISEIKSDSLQKK